MSLSQIFQKFHLSSVFLEKLISDDYTFQLYSNACTHASLDGYSKNSILHIYLAYRESAIAIRSNYFDSLYPILEHLAEEIKQYKKRWRTAIRDMVATVSTYHGVDLTTRIDYTPTQEEVTWESFNNLRVYPLDSPKHSPGFSQVNATALVTEALQVVHSSMSLKLLLTLCSLRKAEGTKLVFVRQADLFLYLVTRNTECILVALKHLRDLGLIKYKHKKIGRQKVFRIALNPKLSKPWFIRVPLELINSVSGNLYQMRLAVYLYQQASFLKPRTVHSLSTLQKFSEKKGVVWVKKALETLHSKGIIRFLVISETEATIQLSDAYSKGNKLPRRETPVETG